MTTPAPQTVTPPAAPPPPAAGGEGAPPASVQPPAATPPAPASVTPPAPAPVADVELKVADGVKVDDGALKAFKSTVKELGLKSEQAQKVFDVYVAQQKAAAEAQQKTQAEWEASLKADKDFGGEKFDANLAAAKKAYQHFVERTGEAGKQLGELLEQTGLGSHPSFVKVFHEISKAMADDSIRGTKSGNSAPTPTADQLLRQAYDHPTSQEMFKKE